MRGVERVADILRLIAGGLLALICCYGGILIKRHYAEREKFYRDAEAFAGYLISEVGFRKTSLPAVITQFAEGKKGAFARTLTAFAAALSLGTPQERAASDAAEGAKLRADEKRELKEFFASLGKTALADQLGGAGRAQAAFAARRARCAEETVRLGGMYFKLAVLLGIALIVMLA